MPFYHQDVQPGHHHDNSVTYGVCICLDCSSIHRNMDMDITFVRGNTSTIEFFTRCGSVTLLSNTDTKKFLSQVVVEGADTPIAKPNPQGKDDFFSSWDKPVMPKPMSAPATPMTGPVIGKPVAVSHMSKLGGRGAKRAATLINFAEAERKAAEEPEAITVLGKVDPEGGSSHDMERLGMGFWKQGFGAIPNPPTTTPTVRSTNCSGEKAISSDMYFGRNDYDPTALAESRAQPQNFQGAILWVDGNLSNMENIARDAIAKILANPDLKNVGESIRMGTLKALQDSITIAQK
ncbi:hypothetical protein EDC04DRAFT_2871707 [Pisolithus marmoratus]|nr:hypothetical protein EDC04DRAFT_2871707 [Pisolithus marmoratus]